MGYGRDDTHNPNIGVQVGGECFAGTLTTTSLIQQWVTANITLSESTQAIYFSIYDSSGGLLGQTSTTGSCGTMFGTTPVSVIFFTDHGKSDVDWIRLTSSTRGIVLFDDFVTQVAPPSTQYAWQSQAVLLGGVATLGVGIGVAITILLRKKVPARDESDIQIGFMMIFLAAWESAA